MMVRRSFHLFFSSLIAYCITSICIISINNNNVIVVNAAETEDAVKVDENNAGDDGDEYAGDAGGDVVVPFMNEEILSCIDSTVNFFLDNPDIENECDKYADTYSQIDNDQQDSDGNTIMVLGYPEESLTALESICSTNNGYWITTTTKLEFTCIVMEMETIKVIVNNYGECLANTKECRNTNISILMEGMFADMDFACYEGDVPPNNFNDLVEEIDSNYFKDDDIFGPGDDDDDNDDEFGTFDDDYEVDDLFTFDGDDLTAFNDDTNDEFMEELRDGLPEEEKENENENEATRPPATTSSNTVETPPVEEEESSSALNAGGTGDESRLDSTNKDTNDSNGSSSSSSSASTSADSSYSMIVIVMISCIVIATVGFIAKSHYSKNNKRRTGSGGGKGGRRGGGRHAKLSQQIGYEMTDISSSGENNLQFESSGNLT